MSGSGRLAALGALVAVVFTVMAWQRQPAAPSATGASEAALSEVATTIDGAMLFRAKGCAACHNGPDDDSSGSSAFPSLVDAASWAGDRRPDLSAAAYLSESMREPWAFIAPGFAPGAAGPTTGMPALELSEREVEAIVDYLLAA